MCGVILIRKPIASFGSIAGFSVGLEVVGVLVFVLVLEVLGNLELPIRGSGMVRMLEGRVSG